MIPLLAFPRFGLSLYDRLDPGGIHRDILWMGKVPIGHPQQFIRAVTCDLAKASVHTCQPAGTRVGLRRADRGKLEQRTKFRFAGLQLADQMGRSEQVPAQLVAHDQDHGKKHETQEIGHRENPPNQQGRLARRHHDAERHHAPHHQARRRSPSRQAVMAASTT